MESQIPPSGVVVTESEVAIAKAIHRVPEIISEVFAEYQRAHPNTLATSQVYSGQMNPYHNQTEEGLVLAYYAGYPNMLWTPYGRLAVTACCNPGDEHSTEIISNILLTRFEATVFHGAENGACASLGPIYAIHRVDGFVLPTPRLREKNTFLTAQESDAAWNRLVEICKPVRQEQSA